MRPFNRYPDFEYRRWGKRHSTRPGRSEWRASYRAEAEDGFICLNCGAFVSSAAYLSGVLNRNHCPYCLWSRHLDLFTAGDRLCACKAGMRPVGLALKRSHKRYELVAQGELMLVHLCSGCGATSVNRIAADDDAERLLEVYRQAHSGVWIERPSETIELLGESDFPLVSTRLFGREQEMPST